MSRPHSAYAAALAVVRGCYGGCQLVAPGLEAALAPLDAQRIRWVVRVAGAREAAQLAWCLAGGQRARRWGIAVDALHAVTMLAVAAASSRYRRPAVLEGLVAAGFALAGAAGLHRATRPFHRRDVVAGPPPGRNTFWDWSVYEVAFWERGQ